MQLVDVFFQGGDDILWTSNGFIERLRGATAIPGNCFFDLFMRRSLGLRIEFPLFLLILDVGKGTN